MKSSSVVIGVGADGRMPLPWLDQAMRAAETLTRSHALLAHGPAGAGHLEFALLLAQRWLCEGSKPGPCGVCTSCHLVRARAHPDLLVQVPDAVRMGLGWHAEDEAGTSKSDAKPSREIRIAQVRHAIDWSQRSSGRGRAKALILHSADALNPTAANALLKTLEEPPGDLRLVLTSVDPQRLLPTVRSRCQRVALSLPDRDMARDWLAARQVPDADALLALAGGSPLEALDLAEEGIDARWRAALPDKVAAGDASLLRGRSLPRVIELLSKLAHDAMAASVGSTPRFFAPDSLIGAIDASGWTRWLDSLQRAARHDEHPWNAALLIEALVTQASTLWSGAASTGSTRAPPSLNSAR